MERKYRSKNQKKVSPTPLVSACILMALQSTMLPALAESSDIKATAKTNSKSAVSKASAKSPKVLPWNAVFSADDDNMTYNIFKYKVKGPASDATMKPENWLQFDPAMYPNKLKLIPSPSSLAGLVPEKYPFKDASLPSDPSHSGASSANGTKIIYAHQGTPMANGWIAPKAGYAYKVEGTLVFGTTNYTPINYNGEMSKYLGLDRVPVAIMSASGSKEKLDVNRFVFAVNDKLLSHSHSKIYPSVIFLKPGESAAIQGFGNVPCPRPNEPKEISLLTPNGEQAIKVICSPSDPVIPGKVTP